MGTQDKPLTAKDFALGQAVFVNADQGLRLGEVTKIGRTRVTVQHPRNKRGDLVERAYPMERIVRGQRQRNGTWQLLYCDGTVHSRFPDENHPWEHIPHLESWF